jgi:hypothetical protein
MIVGTKKTVLLDAKNLGFSDEVAEILGHVYWLLERLVKLKAIKNKDAENIGDNISFSLINMDISLMEEEVK